MYQQNGWIRILQKEISMYATPRFCPAVRHTDQDGVIALQLSLKAWPSHQNAPSIRSWNLFKVRGAGGSATMGGCIW